MKRSLCLLLTAAFALILLPLSGCSKGEDRDIYRISASYKEGTLRAEMDFTYHNDTGETIDFLAFNLFGNAYREDSAYRPVSSAFAAGAYYAGESYGDMEILSVSSCASWQVCGQDENILRVELTEPLSPGDTATVSLSWVLSLARVNHRTGIAERAVNLGNFYPVLCVYEESGFYECEYYADGDPFYSECADYFVTLRAPAGYTVASSGQISSATADGAEKIYEMSLENARDFALVLGEDFSVAQGEACGVQIMYYYYDDQSPAECLELIEKSLTYFSETFGVYLYQTYSVVQTGFAIGGMEYPALVMVGDHLSGIDRNYTAVHETAHQWWYAAVGNNQLEDAWLDEGLAEYASALFFDAHGEYGLTRERLVSAAGTAYKALYTVQAQIFGEADTAMDKKLGEYLSEYQYVVLVYNKGMLLFDTLRTALGEKKFFTGLEKYYRDFAGKIAEPEDLAASFRRSGSDAGGIIRSFVDGTAII